MSAVDRTTRTMLLWIPDGMDRTGVTAKLAEEMSKKIGEIDKTEYNGDFAAFYTKHIWNFETLDNTFCSKNLKGVSAEYSTYNATNAKFVTVLSVDLDDFSRDIIQVNAFITFRWSEKTKAIKIQTLCADQRVKSTGEGTKLLNFVKKIASHMKLYNIYLNPLQNAVPYYYRQHFREARGKIHDSSSPSTKSSKKRSSKSSKSRSSKSSSKKKGTAHIPSMIMNLRARSNWNKTKMKLRALSAITRKTHGKSTAHIVRDDEGLLKKTEEKPQKSQKKRREEVLLTEVEKIAGSMSADAKEMATWHDVIKKLEDRNFTHLTDDDERKIRDYLADVHGIY
jgi:hypothetical protein